ncbi:adenosine 3'-phospho 5'-phosphosulfate transporter 1-like [Tropilaelaps mercedesae]|uniref:Adenosine 3'-phospho 5'-phosphosulfate transporter 1 n=1 Tax=Tropilaelaps mercedesae TaxID=418985 RepID=A0A1V9WZD8_9ACAR|nr:adenosine 3'-phospho 5'-phosphosulfate transporter 1-like [Tropilaelaps mercedesae]
MASPPESFWVLRLVFNVFGYATVALPMFLLVWYVRKRKLCQSEKDPRTRSVRLARLLVYGKTDYERVSLELGGSAERPPERSRTLTGTAFVLGFCFVGLQVSYLTWGVLQEKIMTQKYYSTASEVGESFSDSQFLVFVNRVLAFAFAAVYLGVAPRQPPHTAPLYKYFHCSFSNILSSWFQYEALKFVSFPTQVLAKASKIIPVMLMGKVVSRKTYHSYEYVVALMISLGMSMFLLSRPVAVSKARVESTSLSGAVILAAYMLTDSFTSNWQGKLFSKYKMSPIQMMCGVNLFSTLLTFVSLLQQGAMLTSLHFALAHRAFAYDCVILSICSATGQLFVFYTISQFGPVTFVIMMTIRQAVAIPLSCLLYRHSMSGLGTAGVMMIFVAIFFKVWFSQRRKRQPAGARTPAESPIKVVARNGHQPPSDQERLVEKQRDEEVV